MSARTFTNSDETGEWTFSGALWQLQPVEVRPISRPAASTSGMAAAEREVFYEAGVSPNALRTWLRQNDLALLSVRNVTTRDDADRQQPVNLSVPGGVHTAAADGGPVPAVGDPVACHVDAAGVVLFDASTGVAL